MNAKTKKITRTESHYDCLEDVIGCKWSVSVLMAIAEGIHRPGALERHIDGISTKVLNERLRKLSAYGLLTQHRYAESPPRTEYRLTGLGEQVVNVVRDIRRLDPGPRGRAEM